MVSLSSVIAVLGAIWALSHYTVVPGCPASAVQRSSALSPVPEKEGGATPPVLPSTRASTQKGRRLGAKAAVSLAVRPGELIIPVAGVRGPQLRDTFNELRSAGRLHQALDIPAARGTPVLAATSGQIFKLSYSERGGIVLYQVGCDSTMVYYYAHLERYADGLTEGQGVRQGQVIGYVGATGNAGVGNYHLHFAMWLITDPQQYWRGINVNPYPLLQAVS